MGKDVKHGYFWTVFSIVGTVASTSNRPKLCSFVVFETLYRMRETRKMGYFSFPSEKSLNNGKRRKTRVFLNGFLHGWHSGQYFWPSETMLFCSIRNALSNEGNQKNGLFQFSQSKIAKQWEKT